MSDEDPCLDSVATFNTLADLYATKFFDTSQYHGLYDSFLARLPEAATAVLDLACGPGNVAAHLCEARPDLAVWGIDLAPNMIAQARRRVPAATFSVGDCRSLDLDATFDGAVFAFGLNYLPTPDARRCLRSLHSALRGAAALLLTTLTGPKSEARYELSSTGDRVFMIYRTPDEVLDLMRSCGFCIDHSQLMQSPANATLTTTDLAVHATRVAGAALSAG